MTKTYLQRDTEADPEQALVEFTLLTQDDSVSGAGASVGVTAPEDDGSAEVSIQALASLGQPGSILATASADEGAALVQNRASSVTGTATVWLDAEVTVSGVAESRLAVISTALGGSVLAGITARHEEGVGDSLVITDGLGLVGEPGDYLTADATVGSRWLAADPLTSAGTIVISAGDGQTTLTLNADGSSALAIDGFGDVLAIAANGTLTLNPLAFLLMGLPSVDPEVAGQFYTDGAVSGGVPQALMVSGGPP